MVAKPQGQKYRREHDPYNGMEVPDFDAHHVLLEGEKNLPKIQQEADETKRQSRQRKQSATSRIRQREENQTSSLLNLSSYQNKVLGRNVADAMSGKGNARKRFPKWAPATIITILLAGGGILFYISQSMLPQHLSTLITKATDIQYPSYITRNQRVFKYAMDGGNQLKISNNLTTRYTSFSPYIKRRLAKNGIEVGYIDGNGSFSTKQVIANNSTVLKYGDEIIRADDFQAKFASDANFREAYTRAKRGRIAGFFDSSADQYYKKQGASRDIFDNYRETGDSKIDDENFRETVNNRVTGSEASVNSIHSRSGDDDDVGKNGDAIETAKIEGDTPEAKARTFVNGIANKVEKGANTARMACVGLRIANMAAITVTAYQVFQSISYFLSLAEPLSKTIAGEGDASATNAVLNFFTSVTDSVVQYVDKDGKVRNETTTGSPLQGSGPQLFLTSTPVNKNKVAPYSVSNIFGSATLVAATTGASQLTCDGVMAGSAIISLAANAVPGGTLAKFIVSAVANTVGGVALTAAVGAIVNTIIPYVAKIFTSDIFQNYHGIPGGEFWTEGGAAANFQLATQASAFMPASEEYIKDQNRETTLVLNQEAEDDRRNRSPFDVSSPNTFLGSLVSKLSFSAAGSTLGNGLAGFGNLIGNSFKALNPTANAADEDVVYTSSYGDCGNNGLDTVCDIYGTVIPARDYSTIDLAPDDKKYNAVIMPNLDENGKIIQGSELSKFIHACVERQSPWGVLDANIMNALQTDFGTIGNNLYLVEDVVDIINAAEDAENRAWGTGENCVMSSKNERWDSEFKYYQAYVEDMRIINGLEGEQDSTSSNNPVLAYINEYDAKHPADTSFEGTLASISGYTKDDISFLLEFARYSTEIANRDYSHLFVFGKNSSEIIEKPENSEFNNPNILANVLYIPNLFVDKRNYTV